MVPSNDFMFTLDTNTMTWIDQTAAVQPAPGGPAVSTQQVARCYHQSVLVGGDSLFVLNGRIDKGELAETFYILNTTSWVLSNSFPGLDEPPTPSGTNYPTDNTGKTNRTDHNAANLTTLSGGAIAGIVIGAIAGAVLIFCFAGFLYWKRQKNGINNPQMKEPKEPDSKGKNDPPPGYSNGLPGTFYNQNVVSATLNHEQPIKPEAYSETYVPDAPDQRYTRNVVKPDGE
ncbi:hypothetical protein BX666DRAFT_2119610 [Dichotomocladium elegans]|nr:hypothetical protein BX666DRAFT_2119610 [Dichotomocladium elegans]